VCTGLHLGLWVPAHRREWKKNREKLVSWNKGFLTEEQTKETVAIAIQIRRINSTKQQNTESNSHRPPPPHPPEPRERLPTLQSPQPEPDMTAHGMEYPAFFGQVESTCPAVSPPGFWWKLTLSWLNPGQMHRTAFSKSCVFM